MTQIVKLTFKETVRVGRQTYSAGYILPFTADQMFGSVSQRSLAPFDFFESGLIEEIVPGYFLILKDIKLELDGVTMQKRDLFYANPRTSLTVKTVAFVTNATGDFTVTISGTNNPKPAPGPVEVDKIEDIPDGANGFYLVKYDPDKGDEALYLYKDGVKRWVAMVLDGDE